MGEFTYNTIQEGWQEYMAQTMPLTAGEVQIKETHQAFYAGAATMFSLVSETAKPGVSREAAKHMLRGLRDELEMFIDSIKGGIC